MVHLSREDGVSADVAVALSDHRAVSDTLTRVIAVDADQLVGVFRRVQVHAAMRVVIETVRVPSLRVL